MSNAMLTTVLDGPDRIALRESQVPELDHDKVLVKVTLCGICGSDVAAYQGTIARSFPYSPGHEFCGTIAAIGDTVEGLEPGNRVVIDPNLGCGDCSFCRANKPHLCDFLKTRPVKSNGGLSEWVVLDSRMVHVLPDALSDELAVYVEPMSCAIHACRRAEIRRNSRVAVFGAGTMGILTAMAADSYGADATIVELSEERIRQSSGIPGLKIISSSRFNDQVKSEPIEIVIDCSGSAEALSQGIRSLRKGGRLILLSLVKNTTGTAMPLSEITNKELEIRGTWLNPCAFPEAITLVTKHAAALDALTTRVFALTDVAEAFACAASREVQKVVVRTSMK